MVRKKIKTVKPPKDEFYCPECGSILQVDVFCDATREYIEYDDGSVELGPEDTEYNTCEVVKYCCSKYECTYAFTTPDSVESIRKRFRNVLAMIETIPILPDKYVPEI